MIVITAPGQGSQTPGFLSSWLTLPGAQEQMERFSQAAECDLIRHGTVSDQETIRDTAIAQPLIVSASLLSFQALTERLTTPLGSHIGVAGHSVGELAALAICGVVSSDEAVRLTGIRGRAMAAAAAATPTGMSAILGGDETEVLDRLQELGLTPANMNGAGQIVAAGALDALTELAATPPQRSRIIPLQVAGAFHTHAMSPAVQALRDAVAAVNPVDPTGILWTNSDGSIIRSGATALETLVSQVAAPVRWDLCQQAFANAGVTGLIELSPAGTLVGLARRALKGVPTVAITTPDDLDAAIALIEEAA